MHNCITTCIHTYGKYTQTYTHTYIYDTMTAQHRNLSIMYRPDVCGTYQPEVASHWTFSAIAGRDIDLSVADLPYNILKTMMS